MQRPLEEFCHLVTRLPLKFTVFCVDPTLRTAVLTFCPLLSFRHPSMETPLDVLSRAASFVHANDKESEYNQTKPLLLFHAHRGRAPPPLFYSLPFLLRCWKVIYIIRAALHIDKVQQWAQTQPSALFSALRQ